MADTTEQIGWPVIWRVMRGSNEIARRRALRETITVLGVSLAPLLLGAFFSYVTASRTLDAFPSYLAFSAKATLAGQLFLLFLSLAGTIFARLWDPDGPRYAFSVILNLVCLFGAVLATGLIAIDVDMKSFSFFPVGLISLLFFIIGIFYYFVLAIPSYMESPNIPESNIQRGENLGAGLAERMAGQ